VDEAFASSVAVVIPSAHINSKINSLWISPGP